LAQRRILVVDDNASNRKVFHHLLTRWGCQTEGVNGAPAAIVELGRAATAGQPYELVLLDHQMPEIDGLALARTIRGNPTLGRPALVLLSSSGEHMDPAEQARHGLDAYDRKPVGAARLQSLLHHALEKHPPASPAAALEAEAAPATPRPRILVAEDNRVNQKVAAQYLKNAGYMADLVPNGLEAYQALRRYPYRLVLMDIQMPVMDGLEATQQIRKGQASGDPSLAHEIRIVAMTANAMAGDRELCLAAGMDDYVAKPLTPSAIKAVIEQHLGNPAGTSAA
jgi:CheY-like chemotaxis protein